MATVASPDVAAELARTYRDEQRRISRGLLAELLRLWRAVVRLDDFSSFVRFAELAADVVGRRRAESADAAAQFYEVFRATQVAVAVPVTVAAAVPLAVEATPVAVGAFAPVLAAPLAETAVAGAMRGATITGFVGGRRAGQTEQQASRNALVKASGTATRLALNGGRDTILGSVDADPEALGWLRVTDGDPCAFCIALASRGPRYKSEETAGFRAHDHCGCTPAPVFVRRRPSEATRRFREQYRAAQRWARANGTSDPSKPNYAIANLRRYLASRT